VTGRARRGVAGRIRQSCIGIDGEIAGKPGPGAGQRSAPTLRESCGWPILRGASLECAAAMRGLALRATWVPLRQPAKVGATSRPPITLKGRRSRAIRDEGVRTTWLMQEWQALPACEAMRRTPGLVQGEGLAASQEGIGTMQESSFRVARLREENALCRGGRHDLHGRVMTSGRLQRCRQEKGRPENAAPSRTRRHTRLPRS